MAELKEWMEVNGVLPGDKPIHRIKTLTIAANSSDTFTYSVPSGHTLFLRYLNASFKTNSTYTFKVDGEDIAEEDSAKDEPIQDYGDNTQIWVPPKKAKYQVTVTVNNTSGSTQSYNCSINGYLRRGN